MQKVMDNKSTDKYCFSVDIYPLFQYIYIPVLLRPAGPSLLPAPVPAPVPGTVLGPSRRVRYLRAVLPPRLRDAGRQGAVQ